MKKENKIKWIIKKENEWGEKVREEKGGCWKWRWHHAIDDDLSMVLLAMVKGDWFLGNQNKIKGKKMKSSKKKNKWEQKKKKMGVKGSERRPWGVSWKWQCGCKENGRRMGEDPCLTKNSRYHGHVWKVFLKIVFFF